MTVDKFGAELKIDDKVICATCLKLEWGTILNVDDEMIDVDINGCVLTEFPVNQCVSGEPYENR